MKFLLIVMMGIFSSGNLFAQTYGVGIGSIALPHYLGSAEYYSVTLPFPLILPNDEVLISDTAVNLDFDLQIGLPVTSEKTSASEPSDYQDEDEFLIRKRNYARRGMKDIPWALYGGLGLTLNYKVLSLEFNAAPGFFLGRGNAHAGTKGSIKLQLHTFLQNSGPDAGCLCFFYEALYGNASYNEIFYGVKQSEALADREQFNANKSGYIGSKTGLYFMKRVSNFSFLGYLSIYSMKNSVIEKSPLIRRKEGGTGGLAVAYIFN